MSFSDTVSKLTGNHYLKVGGDVRLIRMSTDQLGGITYTYANLNAFLNNTPTQVPSFVAFAQDEWRVQLNFTLNY